MLIQEDYFKNIFNTVHEAILILDESMKVLSANRSFYNMFKVDSATTIGFLLYDLGNGQWNIPGLRLLLEKILPEKTSVDNYEIEHNFESIGQKTMLLNVSKIRDRKNNLPIILLAIEDITERKRLEDLLTESEFRYRRVFETSSDGIVLLEKSEGNITHANPAVEKMLGYSKEECIGKKLQDIGVSLDMSDFPTIMQALNKCGIINYSDVQVKTRSGQYINTDIYMVDRAKLAQCNIRDVTGRRKMEEKNLKLAGEWQKTFDAIPVSVFLLDVEGRIIRCNKATELLLGKTQDEIIGLPCWELMHGTDKPIPECPIPSMKKDLTRKSVVIPDKDRWLQITVDPILNEVGELTGAVHTIDDVTEHRKLENQLRHAQKMEAVGTLAGGIAHDFNNMLNVIIGYGTMVMDKMESGSLLKEQMTEVLTAAERAANLTKRLLLFSRKEVAEFKPMYVNELVINMEKMLSRIIGEDIRFIVELMGTKASVMADAGQIEQVLLNLATNARDAMPKGGSLTISTELREIDTEFIKAYEYGVPGTYAVISITDTGTGIDKEKQAWIFDPFFTTKEVGKGTGLGLSIAYGIVKQHNGYIKVYSEPARGTTFKIWLPVIEDKALKKLEVEALPSLKGGNETILVAEDDAPMRKLTRTVLEAFGYTIITAEDGEEAITKFTENRDKIALVLLDMIMPKKSGKEACEKIIKMSLGTRILFLSGYTMDIMKTQEIITEGFDFILKPVSPKDLVRKVREILDREPAAGVKP